VLGALSIILVFTNHSDNNFGAVAGVFWIGLGVWYLLKFRTPHARAKHVDYWTAKV